MPEPDSAPQANAQADPQPAAAPSAALADAYRYEGDPNALLAEIASQVGTAPEPQVAPAPIPQPQSRLSGPYIDPNARPATAPPLPSDRASSLQSTQTAETDPLAGVPEFEGVDFSDKAGLSKRVQGLVAKQKEAEQKAAALEAQLAEVSPWKDVALEYGKAMGYTTPEEAMRIHQETQAAIQRQQLEASVDAEFQKNSAFYGEELAQRMKDMSIQAILAQQAAAEAQSRLARLDHNNTVEQHFAAIKSDIPEAAQPIVRRLLETANPAFVPQAAKEIHAVIVGALNADRAARALSAAAPSAPSPVSASSFGAVAPPAFANRGATGAAPIPASTPVPQKRNALGQRMRSSWDALLGGPQDRSLG